MFLFVETIRPQQRGESLLETVIKVVPGERFTPYGLALKLGARVVLESSSSKKGRDRYSLLLLQEAFRVAQEGTEVYFVKDGRRSKVKANHRDILDVLMYFARQHSDPGQDFPFPAGGVGYLSFEFCRYCDTIHLNPAKPDPLELPDALFLFGHVFLIYDHYTDLIYLVGLNYKEASIDLEAALAAVEARVNDGDWSALGSVGAPYDAEVLPQDYDPDETYKANVGAMRQEVIAGNLLQGVPSRRLLVKTEMPAIEAYRRLRSSNPSPYMFYLDFGDYQLFRASPELHVKVKGGTAEIRPIAGTRRRGATDAEDRALEAELLADVKERAEHLMLVDLARNDLGRICQPGTVQVKDSYFIERYSHVMHIVSSVEGRLKDDKTGIDALRASFPAGTVSGAPKIRAIEVIDRLEPVQRRFYSGVVGHLSPDGSLDTCIAIRSALKKGDTMVLQAGGGIVFDSNPDRELEETYEKMRATARSLGLEI
uniref:Anthranilate synthase component 1 n=1 Tax=Spirochaeta aurantia TaxID=147 RepID=TRPE_SPIAU|nr:RecName: Full=Anthranilate synthase component 1; Short=AS; Short=ASI [Spirochaeta aurantia]AAA26591.1 anthranilate synthase component I [Spirochaeta aurantia]